MLMIGKKLSFINCIITWQLLLEVTIGTLLNIFFFNVGFINFFSEESPTSLVFNDCNNYVYIWVGFWTPTGLFHAANVFYRYIYIRYADALIIEERNVLNFVVILFFGLFSILTYSYHFLNKGNQVNSTIKGHFCSMKTLNITNHELKIKLSLQPKMIVCITVALFGFYIFWMFNYTLKNVKKFKIIKYKRNLLSMKSQSVIALSMVLGLLADQFSNFLIERYYNTLGPVVSFKIWWTHHLIQILMYFLVKNTWLLMSATKYYPEFSGYFAKSFPGTEPPRTPIPGKILQL